MLDIFSLSTQTWLLNALIFLIFIYVASWLRKNKNLPPGPTGLPIVGYLPFISKNPHLEYVKLAKKYGDVFGMKMGSQYVVVVNSFEDAKEALSNPAFLGRPPHGIFNAVPDNAGLSTMNGSSWYDQRRFSFSALKTAGMGQQRMEDHLHEKLTSIVEEIEGHKGDPLTDYDFLTSAMTGHVWYLLYGENLKVNAPKKKFLDHEVEKMGTILSQTGITTYFPWILTFYRIFKIGYFKSGALCVDKFNSTFRREVEGKKKELDALKNETFVDLYLHEIERRQKIKDVGSFTISNLVGNVQGFFLGAAEGTKHSLEWSLFITAAFPDVQAKIHKEIDNVVGTERKVYWNDHSFLPYTEAVLMECHRWRTLGPIGALRYALESTTLGGYEIPQGSIISINVWNIHTSSKYWDRPEEFRPERFLTEDGTSVKRTPYYMPFSIGKRNCIGEILATTFNFAYFTTLLQKFEIKFPEGVVPDLDSADLGLTLRPKKHPLCFIKRQTL